MPNDGGGIREVATYLERKLEERGREGGEDWPLFLFADYVTNELQGPNGYYRPWVYVGEHWDQVGQGEWRALIKYQVSEHSPVGFKDRIISACFGRKRHSLPATLSIKSSNHLRIRAPKGLIIDRPLKLHQEGAELPKVPNQLMADHSRSEYEAYFSSACARDLYEEANRDEPEVTLSFHFNQAASTRVINGVMMLVGGWTPLASLDWEGDALTCDWPFIHLGAANLPAEPLQTVFQVLSPTILIALGLVGATWESRATRSFTITQLVLLVGIVLAWLIAVEFSLDVGYVALAIGLVFGVYNLVEAAIASWPVR